MKVKLSHYKPGQALRVSEVEASRFRDSRHMKVLKLSALHTGCLYPTGNISGYSFLFEAESIPRPQCGQKDYVSEKLQWHHQELNPHSSSP